MIPELLQPEIQKFISEKLNENLVQLALKKNPFTTIEWSSILNQIKAKKKADKKLPTWFNTSLIYYPEALSIEQTSSEELALYKSKLMHGKNIIDCSGGFGVDSYYFARQFEEVHHCEINAELSNIVNYNYKILNQDNIKCYAENSLTVLENSTTLYDWIYIDPSRRNDHKGKVFMFSDCEPNVNELLDFYLTKSNNIMIKSAPILDLSIGLDELTYVKEIHIIALNNEVKELLWIIEKQHTSQPLIKAINITQKTTYKNTFELNIEPFTNYNLPLKYLFEPNAAIMKSGRYNQLKNSFDIKKIHQHSHLFTSNTLFNNFPGRIFEIIKVIPFKEKEFKKEFNGSKMNISTRNFPLSPDEIKKKFKIKDGGEIYAFFSTNFQENKIVLMCNKIDSNE